MTAYLGPPCQTPECPEPASQKARWRGTTPPYGDIEDRELCQCHAREAIDSDNRPWQVTPLHGWAKHQRRLAQEAEEEQRRLTMAAQQRWPM